MRTRNANSSKSATPKKTPPVRKYTVKTPANSSNSAAELADPKSPETKRTPAIKTRQAKKNEASPATNSSSDSKPEQSSDTKVVTTAKTVVKRTSGRTRSATKAVSTPKLGEQVRATVDETPKKDSIEAAERVEEPQNVEVVNEDDIEGEKEGQQGVEFVGQSADKEQKPMEVDEAVVKNVRAPADGEKNLVDIEAFAGKESSISLKQDKPTNVKLTESLENEYPTDARDGEKAKEELREERGEKAKEELREEGGEKAKEELREEEGEKAKEELQEVDREKANKVSKDEEPINIEHTEGPTGECVSIEWKDQLREGDVRPKKQIIDGDEETQDCGEKLDLGEQGNDDIEDDPEEPPEEIDTLEEECRELTAIAKERRIKKEHEIFVGGLDRDATEEDLRKVFEKIGEVVEVRLHKNLSTNKNKGYAFVKFANKEHAKKALSEMKKPVIHGKQCGTAPSEDNDTLFLGNICNTWTKEAIKQKLKDYGVEGVERITLVPDVQHEGLSRGFAFLEFSCHADAMLAYKRLQKPDVIFGHAERTAKVAFAEPLREPDPEIMAQVKSVFVDGLPPHWDEDRVREEFKGYGDIVRIVLARNMSSAKRKDFGFVDFSTHEAAVACVNGANSAELGDGTSKAKVRARLSNPLPKMQAVKGGMCGGFRIGHAKSGSFPRFGRGFGQGRHPSNWGNLNRDKNFYHGGRGQIGRMGFQNDLDFNNTYPDFHQRQFRPRGERRGALRGGHHAGGEVAPPVAGPSRPYHDRAWYGALERGPSEPIPPRRHYSSPEGQFDRPFIGRHYEDPYLYDDNVHGVKRPFYMTDPGPDYMGPGRLRPRLEYTDPALFHETRYHDSFGTGSRLYPHDYYGSDYAGGPYSSFYGGGSSYGRGYYY